MTSSSTKSCPCGASLSLSTTRLDGCGACRQALSALGHSLYKLLRAGHSESILDAISRSIGRTTPEIDLDFELLAASTLRRSAARLEAEVRAARSSAQAQAQERELERLAGEAELTRARRASCLACRAGQCSEPSHDEVAVDWQARLNAAMTRALSR